MRANNYLGSGEYMSKENKRGIVLLVSDGKDYATIQAEEHERQRQAEQRRSELRAQGFVDLGLPSGTLWKDKNEEGGLFTYDQAISKFGNKLPSKEQFVELMNSCQWTWTGNGFKVLGPSGDFIVLPAAGLRYCGGSEVVKGTCGYYWSSTPFGLYNACYLNLCSDDVSMTSHSRCLEHSVRLVQD